jgi:hypothetical protein
VSEGGLDTMPCARLTPGRRGDHPISDRKSTATLYVKWESPSYGYRPPSSWMRSPWWVGSRTAREDEQSGGRNLKYLTSTGGLGQSAVFVYVQIGMSGQQEFDYS